MKPKKKTSATTAVIIALVLSLPILIFTFVNWDKENDPGGFGPVLGAVVAVAIFFSAAVLGGIITVMKKPNKTRTISDKFSLALLSGVALVILIWILRSNEATKNWL